MELNSNLFPAGVTYAEFRKHRITSSTMTMLDGNLVANDTTRSQGLNCRVFRDGVWGCAASPTLTSNNAERLGKIAKDNVISLAGFGKTKRVADVHSHVETHLPRKAPWSTGQKMDFLETLHAISEKKYPKLVSSTFVLMEELHEKEVVTTTGSRTSADMARGTIYLVQTVLNANGEPIRLADPISGRGSISDVSLTRAELEKRLDLLYKRVLDKTEAVPAHAGLVDCILGPDVTGILAHEAMGHPCEADLVEGGAVTAGLVGQQVASEMITMVDFAHSYNGKTLPVPVFVDDEGVEAKDVTMVDKGILKGFLHNRETAETMGQAPTGNARSYMFEDEPLIRMRNTLILPGEAKLEDMIADVEDGYLLLKTSNGQADTTTEFMFGISLGYEIKNGKLGSAIKDTTVSGTAIEMLKTVTAVSDDLSVEASGYCGKKQRMVVSMGGPALRSKINIGGA
ncbi:MAG: TldD/PmbA family protein [Myxococcota bacterium]|nr:TldD/PmbA family protein [Myxococcota bacterium]